MKRFSSTLFSCIVLAFGALVTRSTAANPIVSDVFTADPAALVHDGTVYLYTGHDEAAEKHPGYVMKDWLCFSSTDMVNWTPRGTPLALTDFTWAKRDAWAGHVVERDGKFFWYVPVGVDEPRGFAIGVAVADHPAGPFKDALGRPLLTSDLTPNPTNPEGVVVSWDDIDPAVFVDDDEQAWLFWGNTALYRAKLKRNMLELDGPVEKVVLPHYVEAPWIQRRGGLYYLSYARGFPERTAYATSESINGPWTYRGLIADLAGNCNTSHQAIIEFKGRSYFIYHHGRLPTGGSFRRSVCVDYLNYTADGAIERVVTTMEGITSSAGTGATATGAPTPSSNSGIADAQTARPATFVIVHGAWAGGWEFKQLDQLLSAKGHAVHRTTHTGHGERMHLASPEVDLKTHIQDVVNVITWEDLKDIVLVGHSYGGMVITGVADAVPERIKQVIYLDAFLPENGESVNTALPARQRTRPAENGFISLSKAAENRPIPHVVPQSARTFEQPIALQRQDIARQLPTTYILTADRVTEPEKDGFFPFYKRAEARGWPVMIMEGDHVVHLSKPVELADLLEQVATGAPQASAARP